MQPLQTAALNLFEPQTAALEVDGQGKLNTIALSEADRVSSQYEISQKAEIREQPVRSPQRMVKGAEIETQQYQQEQPGVGSAFTAATLTGLAFWAVGTVGVVAAINGFPLLGETIGAVGKLATLQMPNWGRFGDSMPGFSRDIFATGASLAFLPSLLFGFLNFGSFLESIDKARTSR